MSFLLKLGAGKLKVGKQVLVKKFLRVRWNGWSDMKGRGTAYVIAFEPHQNGSYKSSNVAYNPSLFCDPTLQII